MTPRFFTLTHFILAILFIGIQNVLAQCDAQFDYGGMDTICVGETVQLTDQSSSPNGIGVWQWVADGNPLSSVIGTAEFQPPVEGIYTIELTVWDVQLACSDLASVSIVVLGDPSTGINSTDMSCSGVCDGTAEVIFDSPNVAAYSAVWQFSGSTDPLEDLCEGTYVADITDVFGCTLAGTSVQADIQEPDPVEAVITNGAVIYACPFTADIQLNLSVSGGTPGGPAPYGYEWSPATGLSQPTVEDPLLTPDNGNMYQTYSVIVTDANACEATAQVLLKPSPSDVSGNITIDGDPCVGCDVIFYKPRLGEWERHQMSSTNSSGHYSLASVPGMTDFKLMVDPDDLIYPEALQTFYAGTQGIHVWQDATQLNSGCASVLEKDIEVILPEQRAGECTFRGHVYGNIGGNKQQTEDPIPLIDVVVEKTPPGTPQGKATTNAAGEFEFNLMDISDTVYTLYVNIPGIPMSNTHSIQVDPGDLLYDGLDLCVSPDTAFIVRCDDLLGVEPNEADEIVDEPMIYPNPNNGSFILISGLFQHQHSSIQIFDASGRLIKHMEYESVPKKVEVSGFPSGFYILRLLNDNSSRSISFSVTEF